MIQFSKPYKPCKIWIVQAWNDENGQLMQERAYRYKNEAEQYRRYCVFEEGLQAEIHEDMLY